jgi:hypothetical protein
MKQRFSRPAGGLRIVVSRAEAPTNSRRHDAPAPGLAPCLAQPGAPANRAPSALWQPATIKLNSLSYPPGPRHVCGAVSLLCTLVHSSRSFARIPTIVHSLRLGRRAPVQSSFPAGFLQYIPWPSTTTRRPIAASQATRIRLHSLSPARPPYPCVLSRLTRLSSWRRRLAYRTSTSIAPTDSFV